MRDLPRPIRRVLVVDDNEDAAELLTEHLREAGIDATAAYDAKSAWASAEQTHPDLVLVDIELPDEAGDALARRLRDAGLARAIVALSGHRGRHAHEIVERGGFDAYLPKPCPLRDIDSLVGVGVTDNEQQRTKDDIDGDPFA